MGGLQEHRLVQRGKRLERCVRALTTHAGEIADGVVLNYLVSPDYNKTAIEALAKGAEKGCPISNAIRGNIAISVEASAV